MADLTHFDFSLGCHLPDRLTLRKDGFEPIFEAFAVREREAGRKVTFETFCEETGVDDRVMRRARKGETTLLRHQVTAMVARLGCQVRDVVEDPNAEIIPSCLESDLAEIGITGE